MIYPSQPEKRGNIIQNNFWIDGLFPLFRIEPLYVKPLLDPEPVETSNDTNVLTVI